MIKKTITYYDYNDKEVTEDFYFNLDKLELMELEISHEGGLQKHIEKLMATTDGVVVYHLFKDIVLSSVGKKSDDGRRFDKSDEIRRDFEMSPALAELIYGFLKDANGAAEFIKGLMPARALAEAEAEAAKQQAANPSTDSTPELKTAAPVVEEKSEPTDEELLKMLPKDMTKEQLERAFVLKTTV